MKLIFASFIVFISNIFGLGKVPNKVVMPINSSTESAIINPVASAIPEKVIATPSPKAKMVSKPAATTTPSKCDQMNSGSYACRVVDGNNRCYYCDNGTFIYSDSARCAGGCPPLHKNCDSNSHGSYSCRSVDGNNRCYYCDNGTYIYSDNSKCASGCPQPVRNCEGINHGTYACKVIDGNNRCYYCNNGSLIYSDNSMCTERCQ